MDSSLQPHIDSIKKDLSKLRQISTTFTVQDDIDLIHDYCDCVENYCDIRLTNLVMDKQYILNTMGFMISPDTKPLREEMFPKIYKNQFKKGLNAKIVRLYKNIDVNLMKIDEILMSFLRELCER